MKSAIILCSGGLDSVTTAHYVRKKLKYDDLIILFFNYGQRALKLERKYARICAFRLNARFKEIKLKELKKISDSLINTNQAAKPVERKDLKDTKQESLKYYVPCRNTIFLTYALALAESLQLKEGKYDIFTGFKNEGNDGYPDTTPEFVKQINKLSKISCMKYFKIIAPLIKKDKDEIIKLGKKLKVNFKETISCYVGNNCGCCLSCRLRQEAFYWANVKDPTDYKIKMKDFRLVK